MGKLGKTSTRSVATATVDPVLADGWLPALLEPDGVRVLLPRGEIDRAGLELIARAVDPRLRFGGPEVVLDLSQVVHIDYRCAASLWRAALGLRAEGGDLRLAGGSAYLLAILRAVGLDERLACFSSTAQAVESYRAARRRVRSESA